MDIKKGQIGNALESVAPDHVVAEANDIYDNTLNKYQSELNQQIGQSVSPSSTLPKEDGTASVGTETAYARGDHRHPHDSEKQDKLYNGVNIKWINGESILGSGNITITGDSINWGYQNQASPTTTLSVDQNLAAYALSDAFIGSYRGKMFNYVDLYVTSVGTVTISKVIDALSTDSVTSIIGTFNTDVVGWNRIYLPKTYILGSGETIGLFKAGDTAITKYDNTSGVQSFVQVNTNSWRGNYTDFSLLVGFGYTQQGGAEEGYPEIRLFGASKYVNGSGIVTAIGDDRYNIYKMTGVRYGDVFSLSTLCQGYDIFVAYAYDINGEPIKGFGQLATSTTETRKDIINLSDSSLEDVDYILINTYRMGVEASLSDFIDKSAFNVNNCIGVYHRAADIKVSILGDSISTFNGYSQASGNAMYPSGTNSWGNERIRFREQMWWQKVVDILGVQIDTVNAYGGSRFTSGISYPTYISRASNLGNPDVIIVEGGINEILHLTGNSLGEYKFGNATDGSKLREAIEMLIVYLLSNYATAQIIFLIPLPNNGNRFELKTNGISFYLLCDSIKTVCDAYGVKTIDLREILTVENSSTYLGDGIHPNKSGMERISKFVASCIGISGGE